MQPSPLADLTRAAQRQQPGAINALAQALVRAGQPEEAFVWYSRSAAAGDALSQIEVGHMRAYGVGCEVDVDQARAQWELAERQGAAAARYLLATLAVGEQPLALDGSAFDRLQAAAAAGYPPALRALAIQHGRVGASGSATSVRRPARTRRGSGRCRLRWPAGRAPAARGRRAAPARCRCAAAAATASPWHDCIARCVYRTTRSRA